MEKNTMRPLSELKALLATGRLMTVFTNEGKTLYCDPESEEFKFFEDGTIVTPPLLSGNCEHC